MNQKKIKTFLNIASTVAELSPDSETKVGCVLVKDDAIIATGYNGFIRGAPDGSLPTTRPDKYDYMIHSETNCIYNCARNGIALDNAVAFCTLSPCKECAKALFQCGVNKIYFIAMYKTFKSVLVSKDFKIKFTEEKDYYIIERVYEEKIKDKVVLFAPYRYFNNLFARFKK